MSKRNSKYLRVAKEIFVERFVGRRTGLVRESTVITVQSTIDHFIELERVTKAVRQVLALAVNDGGQVTTDAAAAVCERALKTLEA